MTAYVATMLNYGEAEADAYLRAHGDPSSPAAAPYTKYVLRAGEQFRKHEVPPTDWPGYINFMSSLAMNVDIDRYMKVMCNRPAFQTLCSSSDDSADGRFAALFAELTPMIQSGGPLSKVAQDLKAKFYRDSHTMSSTMPRMIADALRSHLPEGEDVQFEAKLLDILEQNGAGFAGRSRADTLFYAAQPNRKATRNSYVFQMEDTLCAQADLVEMGMAGRLDNLMYGGVNINFFWTAEPRVRASYCMVHPCFAKRGKDLLDGKTVVVYYSEDMRFGLNTVEPIMSLAEGRGIIYVFYGHLEKLVTWIKERKQRLKLTVCDLERPPVRFMIFAEHDGSPEGDLYVLPVAPIPNRFLEDLLSDVPEVPVDALVGSTDRRMDLERFFTWFVFAPVT
jgi:hypothetical protein